jgi:hypothetical protein
MNFPISTPYDIIPPPPGPLTPSLTVWIILAAITAIAAYLLRHLARRARAQSMPKLLRELTLELSNIASHTESRTSLERIARLSRRIIAPYLSRDTASLSAVELRSLASAVSKSTSDKDRTLSDVLSVIADLEESLYAPATNSTDLEDQHARIQRLTSLLESFIRSHRPS